MLTAGWGMQRQQFGEQKHWMIVTLAAMSGESAHPAAVLVFLIILPMVVTPRGVLRCSSSMQGSLPGGCDAVDKIPLPALLKHWKTLVAHINTTVEPTFPGYSFYWWAGCANFTHHQDTNRLIVPAKTGAGGDS
ncbi:hypothetical protein ACLK1S_21970 [Escherichia coli]